MRCIFLLRRSVTTAVQPWVSVNLERLRRFIAEANQGNLPRTLQDKIRKHGAENFLNTREEKYLHLQAIKVLYCLETDQSVGKGFALNHPLLRNDMKHYETILESLRNVKIQKDAYLDYFFSRNDWSPSEYNVIIKCSPPEIAVDVIQRLIDSGSVTQENICNFILKCCHLEMFATALHYTSLLKLMSPLSRQSYKVLLECFGRMGNKTAFEEVFSEVNQMYPDLGKGEKILAFNGYFAFGDYDKCCRFFIPSSPKCGIEKFVMASIKSKAGLNIDRILELICSNDQPNDTQDKINMKDILSAGSNPMSSEIKNSREINCLILLLKHFGQIGDLESALKVLSRFPESYRSQASIYEIHISLVQLLCKVDKIHDAMNQLGLAYQCIERAGNMNGTTESIPHEILCELLRCAISTQAYGCAMFILKRLERVDEDVYFMLHYLLYKSRHFPLINNHVGLIWKLLNMYTGDQLESVLKIMFKRALETEKFLYFLRAETELIKWIKSGGPIDELIGYYYSLLELHGHEAVQPILKASSYCGDMKS